MKRRIRGHRRDTKKGTIMEKNRLEAFSDGVIAIIITIMVLELKQPAGGSLRDFLELGPTLLAYFLIAIYWVNHHLIFNMAERINVKILWCNILWLFIMSFIPFATAWVGNYPTSPASLSIYFADLSLASIAFHVMYYLILHENGKKFSWSIRSVVSLITYFSAAVFGGLWPVVTFVVVALVSAWWILPEKKRKEI